METSQSKSLAAQAGENLPNFLIPMTDLRQTKEYARYMELLSWKVVNFQFPISTLRKETSAFQIFIKHIPILGNIAKLQRPGINPSSKALDSFAKKHKIGVLYVEPLSTEHYLLLTKAVFAKAKTCFLPAKTIQIDLTKSEKELLSQMHPKTRYNIKVAQKRGVTVDVSHNINGFIELWHFSARRRGMFLGQKKEIEAMFKAFGRHAHLLLAYLPAEALAKEGSPLSSNYSLPVAGVLLIRSATTAHYMYAASTKTGNKLFAPTLLAWEAIKLAKSAKGGSASGRKCKIFDFEGIYDERYPQTKNWKGFTRFKEGFGGKTVTYPGTFVKYYNPLAKLLRL